jgi:uncharacterized protein YbjT (DUF2867 family)
MFAILGANGKVGRATIERLRAQGAPVRAVVRESSNKADLEALGCEIAFADLHDSDAIRNAINGASVVQVICPPNNRAKDAASDMENIIDAITAALMAVHPEKVLAISDYGAQVDSGTGVTMAFHYLEDRPSICKIGVEYLSPHWKLECCRVFIIRSAKFFRRSRRQMLA